jgi:hypothetical protein
MPSRRRKKPAPARPPESRAVEFLTVGWLLTVLTTLGCELGAAAAAACRVWQPDAVGLALLVRFLVFAALVIGLIGLGLTAAVIRMRRTPPPRAVSVAAIAIGLGPVAFVLIQLVI